MIAMLARLALVVCMASVGIGQAAPPSAALAAGADTPTSWWEDLGPRGAVTPGAAESTPVPGRLTGQVTEAGTGAPLAGLWVVALRSSDTQFMRGDASDATGHFDLSVPPGEYFVYVADPSGHHRSGFHGEPMRLLVASGSTVTVEPSVPHGVGSITGTVTEAGSGRPLDGIWALALSTETSSTGALESTVEADATGTYHLADLPARRHFLGWVDPTGAHATRFAPDSPNIPDSARVPVTADVTTTVVGSLPAQQPVGGGASISGRVVDEGTGEPLADVRVVALRAADYRTAQGVATDADGRYLLDVAEGDYVLLFFSSSGRHLQEWYDDQPATGLADAATVRAPAGVDASLAPATGVITGEITDESTQGHFAGAWVLAIGPSGPAGGAVTDADGRFVFDELGAGDYRIQLLDPGGRHLVRFWDDHDDLAASHLVPVAPGTATNLETELVSPGSTVETGLGLGLDVFPFPIIATPPHRPHDPITDFGLVERLEDGTLVITRQAETSPDGLYGRFWPSPAPPTAGAELRGVRFDDVSWTGTTVNVQVVFSVMDTSLQNCARGTATGVVQGLPGELCTALIDHHSDRIELLFDDPSWAESGDFLAAVDTENVPMGEPTTVYPDQITIGRIEWLWTTPD